MNLLELNGLHVDFYTRTGRVQILDGIDLTLKEGDSLCLVGESGCGKTIVALSLMRLLADNARYSGKVLFKGRDLFSLGDEEMRAIRGRDMAMIFEQPASCLNPVYTVGNQIAEAVQAQGRCPAGEAGKKAVGLMKLTGIPDAIRRYRQYPHEFSGGMQQRAMIGMALASRPSLLIADEPTTSLDVTVQAQIIELLRELSTSLHTSLFLITHDLGVAAELCNNVAVMYAGQIVEKGTMTGVLSQPRHPYTKSLLGAITDDSLKPIKGSVPELTCPPPGCRFHPRCPYAESICSERMPVMENDVRCHLWKKL